jgi:hypothetical protein
MVNKKAPIPRSLKNMIWITYCGEVYSSKCTVTWCTTVMTPFNFEAGHNVPESRGGLTVLDNLRPICAQCNKSMGNRYTIDEYSLKFNKQPASECNDGGDDGDECKELGGARRRRATTAGNSVASVREDNKEQNQNKGAAHRFLSILCMK